MKFNLLKLVVPDPSRGDRPFADRPYGRLRMNEAMAQKLRQMLLTEVDDLRKQRWLINNGNDGNLRAVDHDLKNTRKLLENLEGMMREKEWLSE